MNPTEIDWTATRQIIDRAEQSDGIVGVAVLAPSGERLSHNGDRRFVAASTVKIPIMIELFRQIDAGEHSLSDSYRLRAEDQSTGSGVMQYLHEGMEFTLGDLVYLMISISDNSATNILIDLVGMDQVNATMRRLKMANSTLGRKMQGRERLAAEEENWATPDDYAAAIASVLSNRAASTEACAQMIALLEKQQNDRRIARYLPRTDGPRWGSKTGSLPGVVNDVGFTMMARGPLMISMFCEGQADAHCVEQIIGGVSRAALKAAR